MEIKEIVSKIEYTAQMVLTEAGAITDDSGFTEEITGRWQQLFIELGELLEAYGYEDTDVIHELEVLCEICYQLSVGQTDVSILKRSLLISCKELLFLINNLLCFAVEDLKQD